MGSIDAAFDALDAAMATIGGLRLDRRDPLTRLRALERLETAGRRQAVVGHDLVASLVKADPADVGGPIHKVIADWLRITYTEARRRMRDSEQLAPRVTLTGDILPPVLPATASTWRSGMLDRQHLQVIQTFVRDLPGDTAADTAPTGVRC